MRFVFFVGAAVLLLYFFGLGSIGLTGPDEPRYAQVTREMLRSGDYVTPRLLGVPWLEKPPLYYWLAAASFRVLGVNEWAARLPSALAASGFLALFGWAAARLFRGETARYAVLVLAASAGWLGFARAASPEMLFTTCTAGALAFLGLWLWHGRELLLFAFYGLLGLAMLAKGPTGVVIAGLVLLFYCAAVGEWMWLVRVLKPGPILLFALVSLPWYFAIYFSVGKLFLEEFIWRHHFQRFLTQELAHPGPWWYYLPVLLGIVFPWTPQLVLIAMDVAKLGWTQFRKDHRRVYLAAWVAAPLVFFSLSKGKLPGYVLLVVPAVALWIGHELAHASAARVRWTFAMQAVLFALALPAIGILPGALSHGLRTASTAQAALGADAVLVATGVAGAALLTFLAWRGRRSAATALAAVILALAVVRMISAYGPEIDRAASARPLAREIERRGITPAQIALAPGVRRQTEYGLEFYLDSPLPRGTNAPFLVTGSGGIEARR